MIVVLDRSRACETSGGWEGGLTESRRPPCGATSARGDADALLRDVPLRSWHSFPFALYPWHIRHFVLLTGQLPGVPGSPEGPFRLDTSLPDGIMTRSRGPRVVGEHRSCVWESVFAISDNPEVLDIY
jgi:hypothetical protein